MGRVMHTPPVAEQRPHTHREHGRTRDDPWHWLKERDDPAVRAYLEAENRYIEARLAHLQDLRQTLYAEMLGRIQEDDITAAQPDGPWSYYMRTIEGGSYLIYCRKPRDGGEEQVLLDVNELGRDLEYLAVRGVSVSPDHRILAYAVDTTGREIFEYRFLDLDTGELLDDRLTGTAPGLAWASDGRTVLWCALDDTLRSDRVFRYTLGGTDSTLVYREPDERFLVRVSRSRDRRWLLIHCNSAVTTEAHLVDASDPAGDPRCVRPRIDEVRYGVEIGGDTLWIVTNDCPGPDGSQTTGAVNGRLMRASLADPGAWIEDAGHDPDIQLIDVDAFRDHLVITERRRGQLHLRVRRLSDGLEHDIALPEPVCTVELAGNREFDTSWVHFRYGSLTTPGCGFAYQMDTRVTECIRRVPVPGYDPGQYRTERRTAVAPDGVEVPISLVYRADLTLGPDTPLMLYGYGSYGVSVDPLFVSTRVSLLDRGLVWAIAHVRGGGYLGRTWYEDGKLAHKQRSFSDFVAAGRALHASGLSSPERTVIGGGSAGGLLMGAVLNQAPDLCRAAVAWVPFVDVVSTMLDASIPLTTREWDEWGDPREPADFETILAYSPYDNVEAKDYPNLLVIAGFNDPRVQYWEPAKWVAKLRATATGGEVLLLTHMGAGHAGRSGRYGWLEDAAHDFAWVIDQLQLE